MTTVTFSFQPNPHNIAVIARVLTLLGEIDPTHAPASTSETIETGITVIPEKPKVKKDRKPLTEAEKEVIRQRFAKGRIAKAKANGEEPRAQDLATMKIKPVKANGSKAITPGTPEADAKIKAAIKNGKNKALKVGSKASPK